MPCHGKMQKAGLQPSDDHECVSDRNDDPKRYKTSRNTSGEEVLYSKVALAGLRDFHHDSSCVKHKGQL